MLKHKFSKILGLGLTLALLASLLVTATPVAAEASVSQGFGAVTISADTALTAPGAAPTDLNAANTQDLILVFDEADLAIAETLQLNAPVGLDFIAPVPDIAIAGDGAGALAFDAGTITITGGDIVWEVTTAASGTGSITLTIGGTTPTHIQPEAAPNTLTAGGEITLTGTAGDPVLDTTPIETGISDITVEPGVLAHFAVAPATPTPVVGEAVTVDITAQDQFDNTLTTYSESLFLSQTGADTPALLAWSGANVTDYGDGTGRFVGTWTNSTCTVDVSYTIASDAVVLKVTGDSTAKLGSSAAVTWVSVEIATIVGTTYQNGNDTILITFASEVQPTSEGPWSAAVFDSVKCGTESVSLDGASFTPTSSLTETLTITLDEAVAYLVNTETVFVTPALEAIKGTAGNFVPNTEVVSATAVSGDSVPPTVALTYDPVRAVKDADTLTITAIFSEAMAATPTITIDNSVLLKTDMTGGGAIWTYNLDVPTGDVTTATVTIAGDDLAGNPMTNSNNNFVIDNTAPTIAVTDIVGLTDGADTITITFSEPVVATDGDFEDGNEVAGITLKKTDADDVTVDLTGATFEKADPELDFTTTLTITLAETGNVQDYLINGYTVTFDPSDTNTIEDDAINLLAVTAIDGTTPVNGDVGDPAMSEVVGMIQTGDDTITITFSDRVRPADGTWSANEFSIESPATAPLNINHANFVTDATNTILTITLNQAADGAFLVKGDVVKVTPVANAVLDLAGDSLPTTPMSSAVAIADPAYPYITSIVGTTILGAGDTIVITFSEAVTPEDETWDADEFSILGLTDTTATFVIDGTNTILTITLDEATDNAYLVNDTVIEVTPDGVDHEIFDADDNAVPSTAVVSALVSGDTDAPTIVSIAGTIVPGDGVGQEDIIRIDFSEAVVPVVGTWDDEFTITGAGVPALGTFAPLDGITTTLTITLTTGADLTAGGTLTVTPGANAVVDLAGNEMSTDPIDSTPVQAPSAAFVIDLEADWNLISLPLVPTEPDIEAVLAGLVNANTVIQVRAYNVSSGDFFIWASTGPFALNPTLTEMNDGVGFWIEMSTGDKLVASGSELPAPPLSPPSYPVYEGWNLIGFKSLPNLTVSEYLGTLVDGTREAIYGYDAVNKRYIIPTVDAPTGLFPGQGYWLAVNANGTIYP